MPPPPDHALASATECSTDELVSEELPLSQPLSWWWGPANVASAAALPGGQDPTTATLMSTEAVLVLGETVGIMLAWGVMGREEEMLLGALEWGVVGKPLTLLPLLGAAVWGVVLFCRACCCPCCCRRVPERL